MKAQKGQDIVEFALLLPVFLLIICGIIYVGFFFGDYMTLSNLARTAGREVAVMQDDAENIKNGGETKYQRIEEKYDNMLYAAQNDENAKQFITTLYVYQRGNFHVYEPGSSKATDAPKDSLTVDVVMTLNKGKGFVNTLENLGLIDSKNYDYEITYYVYDEYPTSSSGS